jgi:hypothetical protein
MERGQKSTQSRSRYFAVATTAILFAVLGVFLGAGVSAQALTTHEFAYSFGSIGSGSGEFENPSATAVDSTSHDIYVTDPGNFRVEKFDSTGSPILIFGKEVNQTTGGDVCTAASGDTCKAGVQGLSGGGQFSVPAFVAVDNSGGVSNGDIYIGDKGTGAVSKFDSGGNFISSNDGSAVTHGPFGSLAGLAVDATGNLWVYSKSRWMFEFDQSGNLVQSAWKSAFGVTAVGIAVDSHDNLYVVRPNPLVEELSSSGSAIGQVTAEGDNQAIGLAADPTTNDLYIDEGGNLIEDFSSSCQPASGTCVAVDSFGAQQLNSATGLSIDPVNGNVYVADTGNQRVDVFRAKVIAARIGSETALSPTSNTSLLETTVNPLGVDTQYHFEYGLTTAYGSSSPLPDASISASNNYTAAVAHLSNLQPNTTYHYRTVASNTVGVVDGPDRTFTTEPASCQNAAHRAGPGANLPDCRAYEMVTPLEKMNAEDMFGSITGTAGGLESVRFTTDEGYAADGGARFLLNTDAAFGANPTAGHNPYVFSRTPGGWTTTSVVPQGTGVLSAEASIFNSELLVVGVNVFIGGQTASLPEVSNIFGSSGGPYTTFATTSRNEGSELVGASSDFHQVILQTTDHSLVPAASSQVAGSNALYEWVNKELSLVNITSNGSLISACGARLGYSTSAGDTHDAVSEDGSKIFFISPDPETGSGAPSCYSNSEPLVNPPHLYMRLDGTTTVDVSAPDPGVNDPEGFQPVQYVGAAADGSKVFFMTRTELTPDDTTHAPELYEYNTVDETLTRISHGMSGVSDGNVRFVGAVSKDGSAVYFTAYGKLAPGAPKQTEEGEKINAYRYDTTTGTTTYIATVSTHDFSDDQIGRYNFPWETGLDVRSNWYATPNGRFLAFGSTLNLTSYNSNGKSEIYRYDSTDGSLLCVSCLPSGAAPTSDALFARSALYNDNPAGRPPRAASEDGSYVFFDTADALVPQDTNGKIDVYEWHDGSISLVTSGSDPYDSFFLDASGDGHDVFFGSHAQLVAQDTDVAGDLYDARVGGGFPAPVAPAVCSGDECQGQPSTAPALSPASSELFVGSGNLIPLTVTNKKGPQKTKHSAKKFKKHKKSKKRSTVKSQIKRVR